MDECIGMIDKCVIFIDPPIGSFEDWMDRWKTRVV